MKKKLILWFADKTRRYIWSLADLYDIRINKHVSPQGQHPVILKGSLEEAKNNIPKTVYFNTRSGSITVGENTVFGEDVMVLTGKHYCIAEAEQENKPLHFVPEDGRDVTIGSGCYIGSGAIIIGKVDIGDYAVIGSGSVVTKDVPSRAFFAGIPAKLVKML
jgi:acetyltransferase-like isoleucine patch superfamily enzyme